MLAAYKIEVKVHRAERQTVRQQTRRLRARPCYALRAALQINHVSVVLRVRASRENLHTLKVKGRPLASSRPAKLPKFSGWL